MATSWKKSLRCVIAISVVIIVAMTVDESPTQQAFAEEHASVIHDVLPEPPLCVLKKSVFEVSRTLTFNGENLSFRGDMRLELVPVGSDGDSISVGPEVNWESDDRIRLDLRAIEAVLWPYGRITARARITDPRGLPLSNWSPRFIVASTSRACGGSYGNDQLTPFPPTVAVRGVEGDLWADVVLGKPDFSQSGPDEVVPFKLFNPGGVIVDRSTSPGRMYVWDSGNSRVLGVDLETCYEGPQPCSAEMVIGQPSGYDHSACNHDSGVQSFPNRAPAAADTLCGIPDTSLSPDESHTFVTMAVGPTGDLFVPDSFNNRVLRYTDPFGTDAVADQVWGQRDFSGIVCNEGDSRPSPSSLCFHSGTNSYVLNEYGNGVELDSEGSLWVVDGGNNRVLRFPVDVDTGDIASAADLVLGQRDLWSDGVGNSLSQLHVPSAVRIGPTGRLLVADSFNDRILVFEPPFESGMQANGTFGSELRRPTGLEVDPTDRGLWVNDSGNGMIELWDWTGTEVLKVIGRESYQPNRECDVHHAIWGPGLMGVCPSAGGIGIDSEGNVLVSSYIGKTSVLRFPSHSERAGSVGVGPPDMRLFSPPLRTNFKGRRGIQSPRDVAVWADQLVVSDINRLMFWNGLDSVTNGRPADGIIGEDYRYTNHADCCGRISVDAAGRLWVVGFEGKGYIDIYQMPLTEYSVPVHTIWRHQSSLPVLGTADRISLNCCTHTIVPVGTGEYLWIADTDSHRVLRIRDPITNPMVDVILGQLEPGGTQCNRGEDFEVSTFHVPNVRAPGNALCFPGAIALDRYGNLFVSDHTLEVVGNQRMLVFDSGLFPDNASELVLAPNQTKVFLASHRGDTKLVVNFFSSRDVIPAKRAHGSGLFPAATFKPAFDSTNRMVVGYNAYMAPRFAGFYDDPLSPEQYPTGHLYDFGSMQYSATFDHRHDLYITDINRGRVLIYRNPFGNEPTVGSEASADRLRPPAPLPQYPATLKLVGPEPPYCVVRNSEKTYERLLEFTLVDDSPDRADQRMRFRRIPTGEVWDIRFGPFRDSARRSSGENSEGERVLIDIGWDIGEMWPHIDRLTLTTMIIGEDEVALTNWSSAFVLAENVEACGAVLPTPIPTFTPTPVPTATLTPVPTATLTPVPTATLTPVPTATLTPVPTATLTPIPTATLTPVPTATFTPVPTVTLTPVPTNEAERSPTTVTPESTALEPRASTTPPPAVVEQQPTLTTPPQIDEPDSPPSAVGCNSVAGTQSSGVGLGGLALLVFPGAIAGWRRLARSRSTKNST